MQDRQYYITASILSLAILSGWLFMFETITSDDVVYYGGHLSVSADAKVLSDAAKRQVSATKAFASMTEEESDMDPIRINGTQSIETTASSALLLNEKTGAVLWSKYGTSTRSIASITKLFTALVFLDFNPGWDKTYEIKASDRREGGRVYLYKGEKVSVKDLFHLSLVASGNSETLAMVNATGLGEELFVKKMNEKAKSMGLDNTVFYDPIGLNENNVSTAEEVAEFARAALRKPEIVEAVTSDSYSMTTKGGRKLAVKSTDELLKDGKVPEGLALNGGKTGYNERADYCFVGKFTNDEGHSVISVILGDISKESRFAQTMSLVKWTYDSFAWPSVIR